MLICRTGPGKLAGSRLSGKRGLELSPRGHYGLGMFPVRRSVIIGLLLLLAVALMGGMSWFWIRSLGRFRNSVGMVMVRVPPGEFLMGSTPEERDWARQHGAQTEWLRNERDPQAVSIEQPFWMSRTEVTVGQYRQFVENSGYRTRAELGTLPLTWDRSIEGWVKQENRSWREHGFEQTDEHPATCLAWADAKAFCVWLTRRERATGRIAPNEVYRLPTDAEWEYTCRGGTRTRFAWGDDPGVAQSFANVLDATPLPDGGHWVVQYLPWEDGFAFTAPVGCFKPTAHGLYDLHGNVWEWCENNSMPVSTNYPPRKILRGGSWDNNAGNFRCATRRAVMLNFASDTTGFRVVLARGDERLSPAVTEAGVKR